MLRSWNNFKLVPVKEHIEVLNSDDNDKFLFSADNEEEAYDEINKHYLH